MQVFIQVGLGLAAHYAFVQPVLQSIKKEWPAVVTLDLDAASDEILITQACRLMQEARQVGVYFKVAQPNAGLGTAFRLIEEIICDERQILVLLEGVHARLSGIVKARPHLILEEVTEPGNILPQLAAYFHPASPV